MHNILAIADFVNTMRRAMTKAVKDGMTPAEVVDAIGLVQAAVNKESKK